MPFVDEMAAMLLVIQTSKGASRLSEQFREHTIEKTYHALVEGKPKKSHGTLVNYLIKDEAKNKVAVFDKPRAGALRAELDYEVVKGNAKNSLLKIFLKTGRSHQIRSQLAHLGLPIVGDVKYGAKKALADGSIALAATSLTFATATGEETKTVAVEPPFDVS